MGWTLDQEKAIKMRGGNIIVSAAAGSGKTAVLSERVLDYVINGGDVSRLLVVTFTKAAAEEMKMRIKDKILKEAEEKNNEHLRQQALLVDEADITTMDAFYQKLVIENFERLGITPSFEMLSEAEDTLIQNDVLETVLNEVFENEKNYDSFNDITPDELKKELLKLQNALSSVPFYKDFLKASLNKYDTDFYKDIIIKNAKERFLSYEKLVESLLESFNDEPFKDNLETVLNSYLEQLNRLSLVTNFDELSSSTRIFEFGSFRSPNGLKEDPLILKYKSVRDSLKKYIDKRYNVTDLDYKNELLKIKSSVANLFDVFIKFHEALLERKKSLNKFSFGDVQSFTIDLLYDDGKKTDLAKHLSLKYDEILIDECQDTNRLQNLIFDAISNGHNIFKVGDVKQCIYKFRNACPEIFNNEKKISSKDTFPMLITLSKNFRSRKSVLDFCNFVFENTMGEYLGDVLYNDDEKLYVGASYKENDFMKPEIYFLDGSLKKEKDEDDELKKVEKEAIFVADKIKMMLDEKAQIYDFKSQTFRDIKPSDIAILLRNNKSIDTFRIALQNRGISVYANDKVSYFDNYDVRLIISVLKAINNPLDDVSLMATLRSKLFDISDDDIADCRAGFKKSSLKDNILNSDNNQLKDALKKLSDFKAYVLNASLENSLNFIYKDLDIINIIGTSKKKIKNLTLLLKYAQDYEKKEPKTFNDFIFYLDEVIENKSSFEGASPISEGQNVTISTIHASKGLEYPVVFVSSCGDSFNNEETKDDFVIDDDLGVTFNDFDLDNFSKKESTVMSLFKDCKKLSQKKEELRVLYVAMTRAKEKLIITGYANNLPALVSKASAMVGEDDVISSIYLDSSNSYLEWLLGCFVRCFSCRDAFNASCKTFSFDTSFSVKVIDANSIKDDDVKEKEDLKNVRIPLQINSYDDAKTSLPQRLSVSQIKAQDHDFMKKPYFLNNDIKSTNIGTLYHKIFEMLEVKSYDISTLKEALKSLNISQNDLKSVDLEKILAYLTSSLYDDVKTSSMVYKELPVVFNINAKDYDNSLKNGTILVDGTIDLLFVKDDVYNVVDYKTDHVDDLNTLKDLYHKQLDLYEIAVKEKYHAKKVNKYIYSIMLNDYIKL